MKSIRDFVFINESFNFLGLQPFVTTRRFFILKVMQLALLFVSVAFLCSYRELILYTGDSIGEFMDSYKLLVSVLVVFLITLEPLIRRKNYEAIQHLCGAFETSLNETFKHQVNISANYCKIQYDLKVGAICILLFYCFCEAKYLDFMLENSESFPYLILTIYIPDFIIFAKAFQLIFYMKVFSSYLRTLKELVRNLNEEIINNQRLKSKVYDSIIRNKFKEIIFLHYEIVKMLENFNSSLGLSQLGVFLAMKFNLKISFYWTLFLVFHKFVKISSVCGEFENENWKLEEI